MNIFKKLTVVSLASVLMCGVSFADASDQAQAAADNNSTVTAKASDVSSTAKKGNARTSREFVSPIRKWEW